MLMLFLIYLIFFRDFVYIGRVVWIEYWYFFGCYVDLLSFKGLEKLEDYLVKKKDKVILSRLLVIFQRVRVVKSVSSVFRIFELRISIIILNEDGLRDQIVDKSDFDYFNKYDFSGSLLLLFRKVLFLDLELKFENLNIELKDLVYERKLRYFQ